MARFPTVKSEVRERVCIPVPEKTYRCYNTIKS
uniref:Uncharacterized protein n=1 Tax=Anguilla anguilla TaxID=7936 RepID=A0A0E9V2S3_ANGAN